MYMPITWYTQTSANTLVLSNENPYIFVLWARSPFSCSLLWHKTGRAIDLRGGEGERGKKEKCQIWEEWGERASLLLIGILTGFPPIQLLPGWTLLLSDWGSRNYCGPVDPAPCGVLRRVHRVKRTGDRYDVVQDFSPRVNAALELCSKLILPEWESQGTSPKALPRRVPAGLR